MRRLLATLLICGTGAAVHAQEPGPPVPSPSPVPVPVPSPAPLPPAAPQAVVPAPAAAPAPAPPTYEFALLGRYACVTPVTQWHARADGGFIDVKAPAPNSIVAVMSGTVAANAHLGCSSMASETFQLRQELELTSPDASVRDVVLTIESSLVGFVRSKLKAGACMKLASAMLTPASWDSSPLSLSYPPLCVSGTGGQLCNQHIPPIKGPAMPLGRYTLIMNFCIEADAGGVCDGHAVADFSPTTALPETWVRMRDPFQGVDKAPFGFTVAVTATPVPGPAGVPVASAGPAVTIRTLAATTRRIGPVPTPSAGRRPAAEATPVLYEPMLERQRPPASPGRP